jgi:hypothetical protein
MRQNMRRHREERRTLLTRGERIVGWSLTFSPSVFFLGGIALLLWGGGGTRTLGITLLILALLVMAVPVSPFLRARLRRREAGRGARRTRD